MPQAYVHKLIFLKHQQHNMNVSSLKVKDLGFLLFHLNPNCENKILEVV